MTYYAYIEGNGIRAGAPAIRDTIRECRALAEEFGSMADRCRIEDAKGRVVAMHCRDTSGDGTRWYRAQG